MSASKIFLVLAGISFVVGATVSIIMAGDPMSFERASALMAYGFGMAVGVITVRLWQ